MSNVQMYRETESNIPNCFLEYIASLCSYSNCTCVIGAFSEFENHILNFAQPHFLQLGNGVNSEYVLHDKTHTAGTDLYVR